MDPPALLLLSCAISYARFKDLLRFELIFGDSPSFFNISLNHTISLSSSSVDSIGRPCILNILPTTSYFFPFFSFLSRAGMVGKEVLSAGVGTTVAPVVKSGILIKRCSTMASRL